MAQDRSAAFLIRRNSVYYFRFRLPIAIQSILARGEVRYSLSSTSLNVARERIAGAIPLVFAVKRLGRRVKELSAEEAKRAAQYAISRLLASLELSRVAWDAPSYDPASPGWREMELFSDAFGFLPPNQVPDHVFDARTGVMIHSIHRGDPQLGAAFAKHILSTLGISANEESEQFKQLSVEMLKLHVTLREIAKARVRGDFPAEQRLLSPYTNGALTQSQGTTGAVTRVDVPVISDVWAAYAAEKTTGLPRPTWKPKTAAGQQSMFLDFKEIIGDLPADQITREKMLLFRDRVSRLPTNRRKRHPGKTIAELLSMEIPADHLPSARTVHERLVQIGAFLKWCRETKGYLASDPMAGVHVDSDSQSYAAFTLNDLKRLFNSEKYERSQHSKTWQFWVPLIAVYTGARQSEIAQLTTSNVIEEDNVWLFAVTDEGEGQHIKTRAGVRKIPVSSKLIDLGLLDYVASLKAIGENKLFPDLPKGTHGWGHKVSRWFNDTYRKQCGIEPDPTGRRKVFHSFRHTAITKALSTNSASLAHCQQVFGHEKSMLGETATYMGAFPVATLVFVIEALDYGLDHSHYKNAWKIYARALGKPRSAIPVPRRRTKG